MSEANVTVEAPVVSKSAPSEASESYECCVYLGAHGILATRGAATDSFARLLLVTKGQVEWEIGRTELVMDDLTPNWRKTLRFSYSAAALIKAPDSLIRIEICDPKVSADSRDLFTVMGAAQILLADLHALITSTSATAKGLLEKVTAPAEDETVDKSTVASRGLMMMETCGNGATLLSMELHQKATLQGLLAPRRKKLNKADKKREAAIAQSKRDQLASSDEDDEPPPKKKGKKGKPLKEETAKQLANRMMRSRALGTVLASFEHVADSRSSLKLEVTTEKKLRVNNCAIRKVDPYLRVYRKLTTSLEGNAKGQKEIAAGPWAPTRACILKTVYHRSNNKPTWGVGGKEEILLPEQMMSNRADSEAATLIFEAWDNQTTSKDRMIGSFEATIAELRSGVTKKLKPPHFWNGRQDIPDLITCFVGFGPSGAPGALNIKLTPGPELALSTHHAAFSVDSLYSRLAGKQSNMEGVKWVPLVQRRAEYQNEINTGEEVLRKSFFKVLSRTKTELKIWLEGSTADWSRGIKANAPFYQSHLRIGSEFGSAMKAYFKFFSSMITLNLVLFVLQFPVWVPQILFVDGINPIPELFSSFSVVAETSFNSTSAVSEAGSGESSALLVNTSALATPAVGVFYFDAYQPRVAMSTNPDTGETAYYPLGTIYLLCGFACLIVSMVWVVMQLRRKMRNPDAAVSAASPLGPGSADILSALFGMWDHSTCYSADATSKVRREIITRIKEGEAEAERATEANSVVRSLSERRVLVLKRLVLVTLALLISGGGTILIGFCVIPETKKILVDYTAAFVPPLAVTAINSGGPILLKILVKMEDWSSPAVTLRQTTYRIFALKLVNSLAIYQGLNLGNPAIPCPEKAAGATFMQLILTDFVVGVLSFFLPKFFNLNCIPKTTYFIKSTLGLGKKKAGKAGKKSNKTDPKPPPSPSPSPPPPAHGSTASSRAPPAMTAVLPPPTNLAASSAASSVAASSVLAPAPSPPPSPGGSDDDETDEQKAWNEWKTQGKRKTPASMKNLKPFAPEDEEDEPEAKFDEEDEEAAFAKWKSTKRRDPLGEQVGTSEADLPDEEEKAATRKPRKPDYPLINDEHKSAPSFDIPVEITKILYRQMLLWIGMLISPFIFGLGLLSTFLFYWVQYGTIVWFHKRPKKILDHFAAADTQRDFYAAFLIANAFAFSFFVRFSVLPANPVCGPLRSVECADGFAAGNLTACAADALADRKNYNWLSDSLLPPDDTKETAIFAIAAGNASAVAPIKPPVFCGPVCQAKYVFKIAVSTEFLLPAMLVFFILLVFTTAVWARNARELREAKRELAVEYQDKKMLARYSAIEI